MGISIYFIQKSRFQLLKTTFQVLKTTLKNRNSGFQIFLLTTLVSCDNMQLTEVVNAV